MIALYSRVSTQEQAVNGHSINEQKERLESFCKAIGRTDFRHYTDAGFSGGNMIQKQKIIIIKLFTTRGFCDISILRE